MFSTRILGVAALIAALIFPASAFAQTPPPASPGTTVPAGAGHHGHHRNRLRAALRGLNLSATQQSQIDQAFAQARAANRGADKATRKANRQKLRAQIEAILTPAQRDQLRTALKSRRRRG